MPTYDSPWEWSPHYYGLIEEGMRQGDCLTVCVEHKGRHPFLPHLDACHELPRPLPKMERVRIASQDFKRPIWVNPDGSDQEYNRADLAAAIVMAAREMKGRRNYMPEPPAAPEPASEQHQPAAHLPDVEVWTDDGPTG